MGTMTRDALALPDTRQGLCGIGQRQNSPASTCALQEAPNTLNFKVGAVSRQPNQLSLCLVNHLDRLFFNLLGDFGQGSVLGQRRKHLHRLDEADLCLAVIGKHGDAAGQRHIDPHIGGQNFGSLLGIANLKDLALFAKCNPLAAQRGTQIVDVQDPEAVAGYCGCKVSRSLTEGFVGLNDVVHESTPIIGRATVPVERLFGAGFVPERRSQITHKSVSK